MQNYNQKQEEKPPVRLHFFVVESRKRSFSRIKQTEELFQTRDTSFIWKISLISAPIIVCMDPVRRRNKRVRDDTLLSDKLVSNVVEIHFRVLFSPTSAQQSFLDVQTITFNDLFKKFAQPGSSERKSGN